MKTQYSTNLFSTRNSVKQVEEGTDLAPKFDAQGLIPCIAMHATSKEILMFAYMNKEALTVTLTTRLAHYWSRSRKTLWKKGESSGMIQHVERLMIDDDQDCIVLEVTLAPPLQGGLEASCHVGYKSCFYREFDFDSLTNKAPALRFVEKEKSFDPQTVYGDSPNPTQL